MFGRSRICSIAFINSLFDHGLLLGLADNDHTQYVNAVSDTSSLNLTLTGQSISGIVLPGGVDHGGLAGLGDDDHGHYFADTTIGTRTKNYTTTGKITTGELQVDDININGRIISSPLNIIISGNRVGLLSTGSNINLTAAVNENIILTVFGTGEIELSGPVFSNVGSMIFKNKFLNGDTYFTVNDGGITRTILYMDSSEMRVGINTATPFAELQVLTAGDISQGGFTFDARLWNGGSPQLLYTNMNLTGAHGIDIESRNSATGTSASGVRFRNDGTISFMTGNGVAAPNTIAQVTQTGFEITGTLVVNATGLAENADAVIINSNERGLRVNTSDERCIFGNTTSSTGVQGTTVSGIGIDGAAVTGLAGRFTIDSASATGVLDIIEIRRRTTDAGFGVNGIGGRICYRLENDSGSTQIAAATDAVMTDVTTGSEITEYRISVRDGLNGLEQFYTFQHNLFVIGNANGTISLEGIKFKLTLIGGYAALLTNKTGANSVAGDVVIASTGTADAVALAGANELMVVGVFLDSGIADGSEAWVVQGGIADIHMDAGGCALGDRIVTSATAGRGDVNNTPSAAVHFQEIGHAIEVAAANANARCMLHLL